METKVVTTHELFQKYFGNVGAVNLKHPKMEAFFSELNEVCKEENRQRLEQEQKQEQQKEQ